MRLYLDDDCADPLLAQLLGKAGHDIQRPARASNRAGRPARATVYLSLTM